MTTTAAARGVSFKGIQKKFAKREVLRGIDLEIAPGELVVLLGRSGCGKSTLLRILAGLDEASGGEIWIGDRRVDRIEPRDRGVSMVFQSYALFPHMTVEENLGFALTVRNTPEAEKRERVLEAARMLGIEDLLGQHPRQLSGGQRQRVAIGRAIVRRPEIFLFDEPLSNLDAALRVRMRIELKALHARLGATMVYVTHDQTEAMTLADRIAVLEAGRVEQFAPPAEIYLRPRNLFVATFVGTPAMNLVETPSGTIGVRPEDLAVVAPADSMPQLPDSVSLNHLTELLRSGLRGVVEVVEPIGDRGYVHLRTGRARLVATVEGARAFAAKAGAEVAVTARPESLHRFDASGLRVEPDPAMTFGRG